MLSHSFKNIDNQTFTKLSHFNGTTRKNTTIEWTLVQSDTMATITLIATYTYYCAAWKWIPMRAETAHFTIFHISTLELFLLRIPFFPFFHFLVSIFQQTESHLFTTMKVCSLLFGRLFSRFATSVSTLFWFEWWNYDYIFAINPSLKSQTSKIQL